MICKLRRICLWIALSAAAHGQVGPLRIAVSPVDPLVLENSQVQFSATKGFFRNPNSPAVIAVNWRSSNTSVATFGITPGLIQVGNGGGATIISAVSGHFLVSTTLTVKPALPPLTSITVTPQNSRIQKGKTQEFVATGHFMDGSTHDISTIVTWTTGDGTIATIDNSGLLTAVNSGPTAVFAAAGGQTGMTNVTVMSPWPDATNTGVPPGKTLTIVNGDIEITAPNTVIDAKDIRGCVLVNAPGVVIKRSRINCAGFVVVTNNSASIYHGGYTGAGLLIEDSEVSCLDGNGMPANGTAIGDNNFTVRRLNIHGCENGFDVDLNADIEDSYIHDLFQSAVAHTDGLQSADGSNLTINHNTIYGDSPGCPNTDGSGCGGTSAININNCDPAMRTCPTSSNTTVSNNLIAGGSYTLYCPIKPTVNFRVLNNHFSTVFSSKGGAFGFSSDCGDEIQSGNVVHETNQPLTLQ
ncbi:MAG TPA: Ig-like domain-containing protein [Terriglobales bacterium]|nr:Ig-like domain-containing protein [Terriglobales bacterium]